MHNGITGGTHTGRQWTYNMTSDMTSDMTSEIAPDMTADKKSDFISESMSEMTSDMAIDQSDQSLNACYYLGRTLHKLFLYSNMFGGKNRDEKLNSFKNMFHIHQF